MSEPVLVLELKKNLLDSNLGFVAPDVFQAQIAAKARLKYQLNLGDCFVYALAIRDAAENNLHILWLNNYIPFR
ncbi:MAG: hypothetical protein DRQ49_15900 [Gammaproteobacteria bacterium]|nr:MAG: hypothetical protein DRQ41_14970 [Gammaproteobacteria bacterium]RKZ37627.1 MAG: hypothetical protein DRQ49_15900 [Gammaproteobacteria bacterium]RKZ72209.1 MAG: hypothetical protein DRQ57_17690 [Gammaproteobacteria bacterium]